MGVGGVSLHSKLVCQDCPDACMKDSADQVYVMCSHMGIPSSHKRARSIAPAEG